MRERFKNALIALALVGIFFFPGDRLVLPLIWPNDVASAQTFGSPVGRFVEFVPNITPVATAASIGITEQTFTVNGITTADILYFNGPAPTALCPAVTIRASAANTVAIGFVTLTAAACTPAAGNYFIVASR